MPLDDEFKKIKLIKEFALVEQFELPSHSTDTDPTNELAMTLVMIHCTLNMTMNDARTNSSSALVR